MSEKPTNVKSKRTTVCHIVVMVFDQFPLIPFSCLVDCLRTANRFAEREAYRWQIVSPDGTSVCSSSGVEVQVDASLQGIETCDRIFLISTNETQYFDDEKTLNKLNKLNKQGTMLGSASSGSFQRSLASS